MARLMFVMWEHEPDIIKAAHNIETGDEVRAHHFLSRLVGGVALAGVEGRRVLRGGVCPHTVGFGFFAL